MISILIISIVGFGVWFYFKLVNETTQPVEPQKKDFKTTLYREIEKLKDE